MTAGISTRNRATMEKSYFLKKNQTTPRPSEHPPVMGENVKTFRWDQKAANTKPLHGN